MACEDYNTIEGALQNMTGTAPLDAAFCPFAADYGAGMGEATFALFFFAFAGLGLTIRTQHPGPIMVAGVLSAAVVGSSVAGLGVEIFALVLFFGIAGVSLYIYQQAQQRL